MIRKELHNKSESELQACLDTLMDEYILLKQKTFHLNIPRTKKEELIEKILAFLESIERLKTPSLDRLMSINERHEIFSKEYTYS
ncbi:hypothetical protein ACFL2K_01030 [Candidatus Margulisiibacteriota bacterium]